jgi:hypothetical protein
MCGLDTQASFLDILMMSVNMLNMCSREKESYVPLACSVAKNFPRAKNTPPPRQRRRTAAPHQKRGSYGAYPRRRAYPGSGGW